VNGERSEPALSAGRPGVAETHARHWAHSARLDWVTVALLVAFVVLRLVATLGRPIAVFLDSPSYFDFEVWGGVRFPVVTAFYSAVGDHRAIVTAQAVFGAACWATAAVVTGSVIVRRGVRYVFQAAVLALGLTLPVTRFDNALLSESVAISLTVLLTALALRCVCRPTVPTAIAVFVVGALWAMTRQNNAMMLGMAAVVIAAVGAGHAYRRIAWRLAFGFLVLAVVGLLLAGSTSQIQQYNTAQVFVRRILPDSGRTHWFEQRGMPDNGSEVAAGPFADGISDPAVKLQRDDRFGRWLENDGPSTYVRFLLAHPGYVVTTPFSDDGALPAFATGMTAYGSSEQVLPDFVETFFWPQHGDDQLLLAVLMVVIIAVAAAAAARDRSRRRAVVGGCAVLVLVVGNIVLVTHTAGWEYERLLIPTGVAARVTLLWLLAILAGNVDTADSASEPPRSTRAGEPAVSVGHPTALPGRASRRRDDPSTEPVAIPMPGTSVPTGHPGSSVSRVADPGPG
jgi:hypothetical protein